MSILLNRLETVAEMVIPGSTVADIGADHAQLSVYLIQQKIAPRVIIGELGEGPYARARHAVEASGIKAWVELRQGNGLQILEPSEVGTVVLAGMGGDTIVEILAHDWNKAASFQRFVFQPMSKAEVLRRQLASQGWAITEERLVPEKGRVFLALASRPGHCPYQMTDLEFELGPANLQADDEIKKIYIRTCVQKYRRIEQQLRQSPQRRRQLLAQEYRDKMLRLEEILSVSQSRRHH